MLLVSPCWSHSRVCFLMWTEPDMYHWSTLCIEFSFLYSSRKNIVFSFASWIVYQKDICSLLPLNRTEVTHAWLLHKQQMSQNTLGRITSQNILNKFDELVTSLILYNFNPPVARNIEQNILFPTCVHICTNLLCIFLYFQCKWARIPQTPWSQSLMKGCSLVYFVH